MQILEYVTAGGKSPFGKWFDGLNAQAAAKVTMALERLRQGNTSSVKNLGGGVQEYKINWGPGYRIYFGYDGSTLVILVGGGTKNRQSVDVQNARERWIDYLRRKQELS